MDKRNTRSCTLAIQAEAAKIWAMMVDPECQMLAYPAVDLLMAAFHEFDRNPDIADCVWDLHVAAADWLREVGGFDWSILMVQGHDELHSFLQDFTAKAYTITTEIENNLIPVQPEGRYLGVDATRIRLWSYPREVRKEFIEQAIRCKAWSGIYLPRAIAALQQLDQLEVQHEV